MDDCLCSPVRTGTICRRWAKTCMKKIKITSNLALSRCHLIVLLWCFSRPAAPSRRRTAFSLCPWDKNAIIWRDPETLRYPRGGNTVHSVTQSSLDVTKNLYSGLLKQMHVFCWGSCSLQITSHITNSLDQDFSHLSSFKPSERHQ